MSNRGPSRRAQKPMANKPKSNSKPKGQSNKSGRGQQGLSRQKPRPRSNAGRLGLGAAGKAVTNRQQQVIIEDEFVAEINGSVGFATTQYPVNIGQLGTFPWGGKIAPNYEKYIFDYLEFYYKREVSEYAANGQNGKVMFSFDNDAADPAPSSKQMVLDTVPHVDGMPCSPLLVLPIDCKEAKDSDAKYIRTGVQPANTDIKTYDIGNLYVSTQGCANTSVIGELHVRYKCRLKVPILEAAGGQTGQPGSSFVMSSPLLGETSAATTVLGLLFASATTPIIVGNGIGATVASTGLITVPAGTYLVEAVNTASDTAANVSSTTLALNQSATLTNWVVSDSGELASSGITPFQIYTESVRCVWNTAILGTVIGCSAKSTYASGVCLNNAYIKIELL